MDFKNVNKYALSSLVFSLIFIIILRIAQPVDFFTLIRLGGVLVLTFFIISIVFDFLSQFIIKKLKNKK